MSKPEPDWRNLWHAVWFEHFKCLPMPDGSLLHSKWCLNR